MKPVHLLTRKIRYLGLSVIAVLLALTSPLAAQRAVSVHAFDLPPTRTGVTFDDDGDLYGVSLGTQVEGDPAEFGGVYKLTSTGDFEYVFYFTGTGGTHPGQDPLTELLYHNGAFYGTTPVGGSANYGVIFKINADDSYEVLHEFTSPAYPNGALTVGPNGSLYGTLNNMEGSIYKIETDGSGLEIVLSFTGTSGAAPGNSPDASKLLYAYGYLYGTTVYGGANNLGVIYRLDSEGDYELLGEFTGASGTLKGSAPQAGLMLASDGNMYGTTYNGGGSENRGTIFKVTPAGVCESIADLTANTGDNPYGRLTEKDGWLYGTTFAGGYGGGNIFRVSTEGDIENVFYYNANIGSFSYYITLAEGPEGSLYGTTNAGGIIGFGSIFRLDFAPGLRVQGNETSIANGDTTPSEDDYTLFGTGVTEREFALSNYGLEDLTVASVVFTGTGADQFSYELDSTTIAPQVGDPATSTPTSALTITFDPSAGGIQQATVTITYDGGATHTFDIEANGVSEPTIGTLSVSNVRGYSATLNALVTPNGLQTTYFFEYGTDPGLTTGVTTTSTGTLFSQGYTAITAPASIAGLRPETTYYYRVTATNDEGAVTSDIESFTSSYPLITGEAFPSAEGFPVGGFMYRPTAGIINNAGNILFQTLGASGSGTPPVAGANDEWLISDASGSPRVILREGDALGESTFVSGLFNHLLLGGNGHSFTSEKLAGATSDKDYAYLTADPETAGVAIISQEGDEAPDGGVLINSVGKPALDSLDRLYFQGGLSGVPTTQATGAWYDAGEGIATLVQAGQDLSEVTGDPAWLGKVSNMMAAGGEGASFIVALQPNPANTKVKTDLLRNQAILSANVGEGGVQLSVIARKGDVISGTGGGTIQNLTGVSRSVNEDHAFVTIMKVGTAGITAANDEVLAAVVDGQSVLIAQEGTTELADELTPKSFGDFHVTADGDVIFQATLKDALATNDGILCKWIAETGDIEVLAREGDAAADTGLNYGTLQAFSVSENGNIALISILSDGKTALFRDLGLGFELLTKSGPGSVVVFNGIGRTVVSLSMYSKTTGTGGGGGGMGTAINDAGDVFAVLSIGSGEYIARVYRTDAPPPPELGRQAAR